MPLGKCVCYLFSGPWKEVEIIKIDDIVIIISTGKLGKAIGTGILVFHK